MKILMVSSFLPYPLYSGGHVRLYNLIRELSTKHEITLICEKRNNQTETEINEVKKICKNVITVERRKQWSFDNLTKSSLSSSSFLVTGHTNNDMRKKIARELEIHKYDLIHVETYYVMQNLPEVSIPVVLVEHNIEYQVYEKYVAQLFPLLRPILGMDITKIRKEEERFWMRADKLIAVSEEDKNVMNVAGINADIVANGVDTNKFKFKLKKDIGKENKILFMGDFKWVQNRDSVRFIIKEIWPILRQRFAGQAGNKKETDIKLWIVGRSIPKSIRTLTEDPQIVFDESSSSQPTEQLFYDADLLLAPIRVGGGTSYKIIESMSCGTPVVTMPLSADAIGATDNENILVGKNALELAHKALNLLSDSKLYENITLGGRKLIDKNYRWEKIANDLENIYKSTIKK